MGRRLIMIVGIASAVVFGVRLVPAQQTGPPAARPGDRPAPPKPAPPTDNGLPEPDTGEDLLRLPPPPPTPLTERPGEIDGALQARPAQATQAGSAGQTTRPKTGTGDPAKASPPAAGAGEPPPAGQGGKPSELRVDPKLGQGLDAPPLPAEAATPSGATAAGSDASPGPPSDAAAIPLPTVRKNEATRDDEVMQAQSPAPAPANAAGAAAEGPFVLPPDRLPMGKQAVGVSIQVEAPQVVNLGQEARLKVIVRNTGSADAMGVVVRDQLPDGLTFLESQPKLDPPAGNIVTWKLGTLPANSERVLTLRVKPERTMVNQSFEQVATVSMMGGSRSQTRVQEPRLKVEQTVKRPKVLKGGQAEFNIAVSNPGTGPARNVVIQARLSPGLHHELGSHIELPLDLVKPGERIELEPLVVDAASGGEQSCEIVARSPDVAEEARSSQAVTIVEPRLELKIKGPTTRFTDTMATYKVIVENRGTALARDIRVTAQLPVGGNLVADSSESPYHRQYDRFQRRLIWTIPQLEPGAPVVLSFGVRLGGIQLYQVSAEARAQSPLPLYVKDTCQTNVTGMADVQFQISEPRRVLDVGDETTYEIRIANRGSKDAAHVQVNAQLSKHLKVLAVESGTDTEARGSEDGNVIFPRIDRIAPKGEVVLTIQVKAEQAGIATCQVTLVHDDLANSRISKSAVTHITEAADTAVR